MCGKEDPVYYLSIRSSGNSCVEKIVTSIDDLFHVIWYGVAGTRIRGDVEEEVERYILFLRLSATSRGWKSPQELRCF